MVTEEHAQDQIRGQALGPLVARHRPTFRLPLQLKQMGDPEHCRHRSGWQYVMRHLRPYNTPNGILLDDFVERSFQHADQRQQ